MSLAPDFREWRRDIFVRVARMIAEALGKWRPPPRIVDVPFVLGAQGIPLVVGQHVFLRLGLNGPSTVMTWSLAATVASVAHAATCTVDVRMGSTLGTVTSMCGGSPPVLSAQSERDDQLPAGWTTEIPDPSWLMAIATAADGTTEVLGLTLRLVVGADTGQAVISDSSGNVIVDDSGNLVVPGG